MTTFILPLVLALGATTANPSDVVVVCPAAYSDAMQPWIDRRTKQGHAVELVSNSGSADEIRERIRAVAKNKTLQFVLLVGDARLQKTNPPKTDEALPANYTATFCVPTKMNRHWGGDPEMASDNPFADLDGDGVPELAVGRLPAHSTAELNLMLKKIFDYEDSHNFGTWRNKINFVAGEGGYGALTDGAIETFARKIITWGVPTANQLSVTSAVWKSPYCPAPHKLHKTCLDRMNEGCLFWVFMGHGAPTTLQWARFPNGSTPILRCEDCSNLHCGSTPPIALLFCCYAGAFAEQEDCLAETLLSSAGGPVAVFSGSNVTMPYGMGTMGWQAISEYFVKHRGTLGELVLHAKRETMAGYDSPVWSLTSAITAAAAPAGVNPKEERLEHLQLFNLLGDPTMQLRHPQAATFELPTSVTAGSSMKVSGQCAVAGKASVELVVPLDQLKLPKRETYDFSVHGREQFAEMYKAANNPRLASANCEVRDGRFSAQLQIPADAPPQCHVRIFVEGADDYAVGSAPVTIAKSENPK